jgi:hypothetical protein
MHTDMHGGMLGSQEPRTEVHFLVLLLTGLSFLF